MRLENPIEALAREWLQKATHDRLAAQALISNQELHDIVVFHCQQAMEKALKAFLTWQNVPFRRVHDLTELLSQCEALDPSLAQLIPEATLLARYAVNPRYPDALSEPLPDEAEAALAAAEHALLFVSELLPNSARP